MNGRYTQFFNGILIFFGAILMAYTFVVQDASVYVQIAGLIFLMFGAYRASQFWAVHKDDHLEEENEESKKETES